MASLVVNRLLTLAASESAVRTTCRQGRCYNHMAFDEALFMLNRAMAAQVAVTAQGINTSCKPSVSM